ncbi:hypothetical protein GCM10028807_46520 [Spirosoma daeguense]
MRTKHSIGMVVGLLMCVGIPSQAVKDLFPTPALSPNQLFYLQRSKDANTVIYEARLTADRILDPTKPVDVYWMRYAEKGQREDLSSVQWRMAYGYTHKAAKQASNTYNVSLHAFQERPLQITYHHGKPVAMMQINGQKACLRKVFVQVDPKPHLIPHVAYVDMFGTTLETGQPVYERIIP